MEDAATAEICRAQVWQWLQHGAVMESGRAVTSALVHETMERQAGKLRQVLPEGQLETAVRLYSEMLGSDAFPEFLTLRAYECLE